VVKPVSVQSVLPWYDQALGFKLFMAAEESGVLESELPAAVVRAVHRELQGLAASTEANYAKAWRRWAAFCEFSRLCPLPAVTTSVLAWIVEDLATTIAASQMQPYLSAVNKAHEHLECARPAVGPRVKATRKSVEGDSKKLVVEARRIRVSADAVADALDLAVNEDDVSDHLVRCTAAVVVDSVCCSRGDTGVGIREGDIQLREDRGVVIRLRDHKGEVKQDGLTGQERVLVFEPDAVVGLHELLSRWERVKRVTGVQAEVGVSSYYVMAGEANSSKWKQSKMNDFLHTVLAVQGVTAPAGFSYSYHSLRKMAASSMASIGVSDQRIMMLGRWKNMASANKSYIDPACADTYGCYRLFGHLLPAADRLVGVAKVPADVTRW